MNIHDRMNHFNVPGVGIVYFGQLKPQWSQYLGVLQKGSAKTVNNKSIFHACSISKMITSLCVLKLTQDGILDLNKDVNDYLSSWKIPDNDFTRQKQVTLAHLLSHQAGFYDVEGSFEPYKTSDKPPKAIDILQGTTSYHPEAVQVKYVPGTNFAYSDAGYSVIEQILEDVLGESISQLAKRLIFKPLQLRSTFFWEIDKELASQIDLSDCAVGHNRHGEIVAEIRACYPNIGGAALWTTPEELTTIVIDIIKAYQGMDSVILKQELAKLMLTPFGCAKYAGMGVFLSEDKNGEPYFFSQGWGVGMQCKLRAYYKKQNGVIVMTNSEPGMEQDRALIGEIIESVCEA